MNLSQNIILSKIKHLSSYAFPPAPKEVFPFLRGRALVGPWKSREFSGLDPDLVCKHKFHKLFQQGNSKINYEITCIIHKKRTWNVQIGGAFKHAQLQPKSMVSAGFLKPDTKDQFFSKVFKHIMPITVST